MEVHDVRIDTCSKGREQWSICNWVIDWFIEGLMVYKVLGLKGIRWKSKRTGLIDGLNIALDNTELRLCNI